MAYAFTSMSSLDAPFELVDLGRMAYAPAFERQRALHDAIVASREAGAPRIGTLVLVEHDPPVITVSRRPEARGHLLASGELLARHGVEVAETDRGGDITYHGPGQLVAYPIFDLNTLGLNLHAYMRMLEQAVIDTCSEVGVRTVRDPGATGVWTVGSTGEAQAKIAALGVRVRRWVTMHGLALNVSTNLEHFDFIVPCGLAGRSVTSLERELKSTVQMEAVKASLVGALSRLTSDAARGVRDRAAAGSQVR